MLAIGSCSSTCCGIWIVNVAPTPYSDSTRIFPSINSQRFLLMASPSPVPVIFRFFLVSTWLNTPNSLSISSGLIPIPVSCTFTLRRSFPSSSYVPSTSTRTKPWFVNLIAFPMILIRICLILSSSPINFAGRVCAILTKKWMPLSTKRTAIMFTMSTSMEESIYGLSMISNFLDSIFEISKMSLMIFNSTLPEFRIRRTSCLVASPISLHNNSSLTPMMVFIGVRIS